MKHLALTLSLLAMPCICAPAQTVPALINYQGQLTDANGTNLPTADYSLAFSIWDAATGGNLVWGPQLCNNTIGLGHGPKIPVVQGFFNVMLGPVDTDGDSIATAFNATNRYLQITVGNNSAITPRQQILSAPYAIRAGFAQEAANAQSSVNAQTAANAQALEGRTANSFVSKSGDTMTGMLNLPLDGLNVGSGQLVASGGNVGITVQGEFAVNRNGQTLSFNGNQLLFSNTPSYTFPSAHLKLVDADYAGGRAIIHAQGNGGLVEALWVGSSGNAGIGTTLPQAKLDVAGTLKIAGMAQQSLAKSGYIQLGELIVQWGEENLDHEVVGSTTKSTVMFPIAFPNEVFKVIPGIIADPSYSYIGCTIAVESMSRSQAVLWWHEWSAPLTQRVRASYIAIGR